MLFSRLIALEGAAVFVARIGTNMDKSIGSYPVDILFKAKQVSCNSKRNLYQILEKPSLYIAIGTMVQYFTSVLE